MKMSGHEKYALENINTHQEGQILTAILSRHSENSKIQPKLSSKLLRAWSSPIDAIKPG